MRRLAFLCSLLLLAACDGSNGSTVGADASSAADSSQTPEVAHETVDALPTTYVAQGSPFAPGELEVRTWTLSEEDDGTPQPLLVFAPVAAGRYPLVQFQHGFLSANHWYRDVLSNLASHGFVVMAPQMYPADGIPLQKPTAFEEAVAAAEVLNWARTDLPESVAPAEIAEAAGLAGHSRGGKVIWALLRDDPAAVQAVVGVDPVDGEGGPFGGEERILDGEFSVELPTLVLGTGRGPEAVDGPFAYPCAPEGDNHAEFWASVTGTGWHVVVPGYGHNDMLDEVREDCEPLCDEMCPGGPETALMRQLTGGLLAAFFRFHLQGDETAGEALSEEAGMPLPVTIETQP